MVHRQGAGMLDIRQAVESTASVTPGKLSLGEIEGPNVTRTLTIKNDGPDPVTYELGHEPAVGSVGAYFAGTLNVITDVTAQPSLVSFSAPTVLVPAGGSAAVDVTVTPAAGMPVRGLLGGYVTLTPQGGGPVQRVPYLGLKGDYQTIQVLTFPGSLVAIGRYNSTTGGCTQLALWSAAMAAQTFTFSPTDQICVLGHFDHPSANVQINVRNAGGTTMIGKAVEVNYLGRNETATGRFFFSWDGIAVRATGPFTVPNGSYTLQLQVLKALGSLSNPAHVETFSIPITIARP
jgi:hypothetical protein